MSDVLYAERFPIAGGDFEHGGEVAARVKTILKDLGLDAGVVRRLSIANFEAEMNVIMYATAGELSMELSADAVAIEVRDRGQGIADTEQALQEGFSTATAEMRARGFGAGMGLPNIRRSADWFEIQSAPGVGTTLRYGVRLPAGARQAAG
jgi:serine/threonine-protein kinase RsbT